MDQDLFDELMTSVREAGAVLRGERDTTRNGHSRNAGQDRPTGVPEPRAVRDRLNLTRAQFAALIGVSERTVEGWEQGRRTPSGPALTLLRVADRYPESVLDAVRPPNLTPSPTPPTTP